jgi:8-oxo-dGTP diphosphatase
MKMKRRVSKDIVVTALLTDEDHRILIVKPTHKEGWILPGGYVEIGESPSEACQREVEAELGIVIQKPSRLLSIDYHCHRNEYIMFIFDGGVLSNEQLQSIRLPSSLKEFLFVPHKKAITMLRPNSARRLLPTITAWSEKNAIAYLEHERVF